MKYFFEKLSSLESETHSQGGDIAISSLIQSEPAHCAKHGWIKSVVENFECSRRGERTHEGQEEYDEPHPLRCPRVISLGV